MSHLLTFELSKNGQLLEIHLDQQGAKELISYLEPLVDATKSDHIHLATPECGGTSLTSQKQGEQSTLIDNVKIMFWDS